MSIRPASIPVFALTLVLWAASVCAAPVERESADRVAANWVRQLARDGVAWTGTETAVVHHDLLFSGQDPVAHLYAVEPAGYVLVPLRDELSPVTAWSATTVLSQREPGGFFDLVRDDLGGRLGQIARKQRAKPVGRHPSWDLLDVEPERFADVVLDETESVGPLLTSSWQQGWPYNTLCPWGSGGRTYVGCTPLAAAQLLYHYRWPLRGEGSRSYWWDGDDLCGGSSGATVEASFVEPYDWSAMEPVVDWNSSPESQAAVAALCYEVAVACQTDFSYCGSAAGLSSAMNALITHFRFKSSAREQMRFRFTDQAWFQMIRAEIDAGRPALYSTIIHTMVVDGWSESAGLEQIHINYGWAGESDDWYTLDSIETSFNPQTERVIVGLEPDTGSPLSISRFEVNRLGAAAKLTWRVEGVLDASNFNIWRGDEVEDRSCLTSTPLTGGGDYVWIDLDAPLDETCYWIEERIVGAPSVWAGPVKLVSMDDIIDRPYVMDGANPFNPKAVLRFGLDRSERVNLSVYDLAGRRLAVLVDGELPPGQHRAVWDGRDAAGRHAPSGLYLMRLTTETETRTLRATLAR